MATIKIIFHLIKHLLAKPKGKDKNLSAVEYRLTRLWSGALDELTSLAVERKDWHEFNHCFASILVGNSNHDNLLPECIVPRDRPITAGEILIVEVPNISDSK